IADMPALDRMVLRVLIVHSWRRVILKAPALPPFLFPPTWRGAACADKVSALLRALPPTALGDLAAEAAAAAATAVKKA
ncbi:MAG: PaaX family transcriptional regulator C-terminal domain-containing protein, partial [Alphaproteobacteria bacterium]|nr:PaaX family transcriptional regulator C-terminal domain-containing protein [Alphaproteobacteria bacterium]